MNHTCDVLTDGQTDRQTYGIAVAYARNSIYAVTRKKSGNLSGQGKSGKGQGFKNILIPNLGLRLLS